MLYNASSGIVLKKTNSYYYCVGSSTSMMKNTDCIRHIAQSALASKHLEKLMLERKESPTEAYVLYYFLIETLFQREKKESITSFDFLYATLKADTRYALALKAVTPNMSFNGKLKVLMRKVIPSGRLYYRLFVK